MKLSQVLWGVGGVVLGLLTSPLIAILVAFLNVALFGLGGVIGYVALLVGIVYLAWTRRDMPIGALFFGLPVGWLGMLLVTALVAPHV